MKAGLAKLQCGLPAQACCMFLNNRYDLDLPMYVPAISCASESPHAIFYGIIGSRSDCASLAKLQILNYWASLQVSGSLNYTNQHDELPDIEADDCPRQVQQATDFERRPMSDWKTFRQGSGCPQQSHRNPRTSLGRRLEQGGG